MPSGNPENIPIAVHLLWDLAPLHVLNLGAGYGKYGVLFREYLELRHARGGREWPGSEVRVDRVARIDAVEGFASYIGELHKIVYDNIYIENILDFIKREWEYDFIFLCDVLEHIDKPVAQKELLPTLVDRARTGVLVIVPAEFEEQEALFGNALEIHRSFWSAKDFRDSAPYAFVGRKGVNLAVFLTRDKAYYQRVRGNPLRRKLRAFKRALRDSW